MHEHLAHQTHVKASNKSKHETRHLRRHNLKRIADEALGNSRICHLRYPEIDEAKSIRLCELLVIVIESTLQEAHISILTYTCFTSDVAEERRVRLLS